MKKVIIGIILVLLLTSQAQAVKTVVEKEVVASEHGMLGEWTGFGDRLYKLTYSDGSKSYKLVRSGSLEQAYITNFIRAIDVPAGGDPSGNIKIPMSLYGASCRLSNSQPENRHTIYFSYSNQWGQQVIDTYSVNVPCDDTIGVSPTIPNSMFGAKINTAGTYQIYMHERIQLGTNVINGDVNWLELRVSGVPTPTQTASLEGFIKVASNIPASVSIDGAPVGITGSTFSVSSGGHDVKVAQSGYNTYNTHVTVDFGQTVTVYATLSTPRGTPTPSPTPTPSTGESYIKVTSNIPANVNIDGATVGKTENTFTVSPGGHDIKVSESGYTTFATHVTADYGATATVDAYLSEVTPTPTPDTTITATATGTPSVTTTSSIDVTYGAGSKDITYRGVDIRSEDGIYYVGDIPHDSIAEAKKTIDEMIAGKEEKKSIGDSIASYWLAIVIAAIVGGYVLLSKKEKTGKKKK